jgi:integrase
MSDLGADLEMIADLVGHKDTRTTRQVYRHQLRPVITKGAEMIEAAFETDD